MNVCIYFGEGVGLQCFRETCAALRRNLPSFYKLQKVDPLFFTSPNWEEETALVVFPGGCDRPYHAGLQGEANARLRAYVCRGGAYLGLCAGGYYGAAEISFEEGEALEVSEERELAFYPGRAVGSAYEKGLFRYETEEGARAALVSWRENISPAYFNGGCFFESPEDHPSVSIIARYHDLETQPAAIVLCHVEEGRALLSGVHPEFTAASLQSQDHPAYTPLLTQEPQREALWTHILNTVLNKELI